VYLFSNLYISFFSFQLKHVIGLLSIISQFKQSERHEFKLDVITDSIYTIHVIYWHKDF